MTASGNKEKSVDNVKHSSAASKITPEKNNVLPSSRSSESMSVNSGNKSITTSTNSQNNTFKVRRDTSYYTGSAPITTDIPIFREESLEHNKVQYSIIIMNENKVVSTSL